MNKYKIILEGLKEFYRVNEDLRADLENYSKEATGRTLDNNIELFARQNAKKDYSDLIIEELDELNSEPHSISDMETMYDFIDEFTFLET